MFVTTCCERKSKADGLLPASVRYIEDYLQAVRSKAREQGETFMILSGKYGLISPLYEIPYYDHPMTEKDIPILLPKVVSVLKERRATRVVLFIPINDVPILPYIRLMGEAANEVRLKMEVFEIRRGGRWDT